MSIPWNLVRQIVAFGCVGVVATLIHYCVALFSVDYFAINIFIANILGYVAAVCISLFGHGAFTYQKKVSGQIARRFVVVSFCTLVVSEGVLSVLELGFTFSHQAALAVVVLTIPAISFFLNKFWVYTEAQP